MRNVADAALYKATAKNTDRNRVNARPVDVRTEERTAEPPPVA